jgi:HSP20 family protein
MAKETTKKPGEMKHYEPSRALSPLEEMERMFEGFIPRGWMRPFHWGQPAWSELARPFEGRVPNVDVIDRDDEVIVRAEVPGINKDDLEVSVTDNAVTIKGETKHEEKEEKGDYYRCEISSGAFTRTVALPGTVSSSDATAKFENGVLELKLPKMEKTKRRTVKID